MWISNAALACGNVLQRDERLAAVRVVEHGVTLAERAALDVLTGQPDRHAVGEDGGEGEFLGSGPVDRSLGRVVQHRLAPLASALELLVKRESSGCRLQGLVDLSQPLERDSGFRRARPRPAGAGSGTGGSKSSSGFSEAKACSSTV